MLSMPNLRKYIKSDLTFEQGPIRPPSEARSLLMRFTRNCPWNKCTFCPIYKGQKFSRRSVKEIKRDIDNISEIIDDIKCISLALGEGGRLTRDVLKIIWSQTSAYYYRTVALWLYYGEGNVFIQDANSLIMPTSDLVEVLRYLKEKIPGVRRITSYARSSTLSRKTIEEVKEAIKEAKKTKVSFIISRLNEHQRIIYEILAEKKRMPSGELYREYCKRVSKPVIDRTYRNYMKEMVELGLVRVLGSGRWRIYEIIH